MFESFVILLREGVEAALIIAILLVALRRTGRPELQRAVFWGLGLAVIASIGSAWMLSRVPINAEAWEGVLYLISAVFVGSMMVWMHRHARTLKSEIETAVQRATDRPESFAGALTLGSFTFLMVFREGAETVLFLSAVRLTTDSLLSFVGALLGLAAAVTFGVLFVRGSVKVDLRRFFFVTEWVLGVFVVQLLINGYHELAEAGWVFATPTTMSLIGPIVRHNTLFTLALLAIPLFVWVSRSRPAAQTAAATSAAQQRLHRAREQRERRLRLAGMGGVLGVLVVVGISYAKELTPRTITPPEPVKAVDGLVHIALDGLETGVMRRFGIPLDGHLVRFLILKMNDGTIRTAFDACEICGVFGYNMETGQLACLNCAALIPVTTMGTPGGCNPIPLPSTIGADHVAVAVADLRERADDFETVDSAGDTTPDVALAVDPMCGMQVRIAEAGEGMTTEFEGSTYHFCSSHCRATFEESPAIYLE